MNNYPNPAPVEPDNFYSSQILPSSPPPRSSQTISIVSDNFPLDPRLLASEPAPDDSELSEDNIPATSGPFLEGIQSRNIDIDSDINISQGSSPVAERTTGHDFLQAKPKVRKSHIYEKANGETIMVDGKPRWQCNRCTDRQAPTTFAASSTRNAIDHLRRCHQIGPLGPVAAGLTTTQFSIQSAFGNIAPKIEFNADVFHIFLFQYVIILHFAHY
ncbi:hypothetical protein HOY82DRAFT_543564 [Tuber indicum]|nr:hypothetical protein HOY82DRAFT_543564 [Tuber indicum]